MKCVAKYLLFFFLCNPYLVYTDELQDKYYIYTLKKGNVLQEICDIFHVSLEELKKSNETKVIDYWVAGSNIKIPLSKTTITLYKIQKGDSLYSIAKKYNLPPAVLQEIVDPKIQKNMWIDSEIFIPSPKKSSPTIRSQNATTPTTYTTYTVQSGDTYYGIARTAHVSIVDLQVLNNNKPLQAGMTIRIPNKIVPTTTKSPKIEQNLTKDSSLTTPSYKKQLLNKKIPYNGKLFPPYKGHLSSYSPLVSGITYTVNKDGGKYIFSPITGIITDIKPVIGFGMGIFITHGDTTVIVASKGFSNFLIKKNEKIQIKETVAYAENGYKLYLFMIKNGKVLPPF